MTGTIVFDIPKNTNPFKLLLESGVLGLRALPSIWARNKPQSSSLVEGAGTVLAITTHSRCTAPVIRSRSRRTVVWTERTPGRNAQQVVPDTVVRSHHGVSRLVLEGVIGERVQCAGLPLG